MWTDSMKNTELISKYESMLIRARRETKDPSIAHWAAGFAMLALDRTNDLISAGELVGFHQCVVGFSVQRVSISEPVGFKDGTGCVALIKSSPWEAANLARTSLKEHGQVWICLQLSHRSYEFEGKHLWCSARVDESLSRDFEAFWDNISLELARLQTSMAELSYDTDEVLRLDILVEKDDLLQETNRMNIERVDLNDENKNESRSKRL